MNQQLPTEGKLSENRGIVCSQCGGIELRVIYTRKSWGNRIIRRRECRQCGRRLTTYERAGT